MMAANIAGSHTIGSGRYFNICGRCYWISKWSTERGDNRFFSELNRPGIGVLSSRLKQWGRGVGVLMRLPVFVFITAYVCYTFVRLVAVWTAQKNTKRWPSVVLMLASVADAGQHWTNTGLMSRLNNCPSAGTMLNKWVNSQRSAICSSNIADEMKREFIRHFSSVCHRPRLCEILPGFMAFYVASCVNIRALWPSY